MGVRRCAAATPWVAVLVAAAVALALPAGASAAITSVLAGKTMSGNAIPCTAQSDGVRVCHGTDGGGGSADLRLKSFDGTPLEVWVILPPAPASGSDGRYPLVVQSHGWGGSAGGPNDTQFYGPTADTWAKSGYAVLQLTARGFNDSCGSTASRLASPVPCASGYIRLDDDRYEVRDIQNAVGLLVDAGIVDPARIGATGESYGGGVSLQLATLKNRVMNANGSLTPWKSPNGTPLSIAAAAPVIPWSDLVYSLLPNGRTLDYQIASPTDDLSPIGVEKQSFVTGLYALGEASGQYSAPGTNEEADLTNWYSQVTAGEPYDTNPQAKSIVTEIAHYHSAYYLLDGSYGVPRQAPPPLLIANGFTDDLFPVDEAVRYYNLAHSLYPSDPISLLDGDFGHQRAQNKDADKALLLSHIESFFDRYVKGSSTGGQPSATAEVVTCPASAPSGPVYSAPSWSALHPGEVDFRGGAAQTISSAGGDPTVAKTFDPIAGGGACATAPAGNESGTATYRLPAATGAGYTLLGSPTVIANLQSTGTYPIIATRLLDVNPATNTETLVARGVYRLDPNHPNGLQVFQLHPGAWHFAAGHVAKLELLGRDAPYVRASNGSFSITVSGLQLRLPVHEQPGSSASVKKPLTPVVAGEACTLTPTSAIAKRRTRASRTRIALRGTARAHSCVGAGAAARRRAAVTRVNVLVYRRLAHGRCRFLRSNGRLSAARSCARPLALRAKGTRRWKLTLRVRIPAGRYTIRADAVDRAHRHQQRSRAATQSVRIR